MNFPQPFENRIRSQFGDESQAFLTALTESSPVSFRVNNYKYTDSINLPQVKWEPKGYYLENRPIFTLDPLIHAGVYYVQEAGSMFVGEVVRQTIGNRSVVALDLCASPGGKTTHLLSTLSDDSLLVTNEVIKTRAIVLKENVQKWGCPNVVVTNNDPKQIGELTHFFDLILVDAPCSGEGMFRKDEKSISEWSEDNVVLCAERQRRILADVWESLKPGGFLIYSTCTYNEEENEKNVDWIKQNLGAERVEIKVEDDWNITVTPQGYHFYPYKTKGEGFFLSVLRKNEGDICTVKLSQNKKKQESFDTSKIKNWIIDNDNYNIQVNNNIVYAFAKQYQNHLLRLLDKLHIINSGLIIGELKGKDIIPDQALALSVILNKKAFPTIDLSWKDAILYLKKENIFKEGYPKGWLLATYNNIPLGFLKNIGNRFNNNYPSEWRIKMAIDTETQQTMILR